MNEAEAAAAPASTKFTAKMIGKGCETLKFTMAISPLDCMGCTLCVKACPTKEGKRAIEMTSQESQLEQQAAFDYAVANVASKALPLVDTSVKGSQFKQPLLEFSGSCAGCAETSYARLITQLFGERMYISNATGCSSIWGGSAPATPYTVNRESGRGPAWANSLF
jgi:pyruvate-ferredoxin/flavodoxin oxidoreductase